MRAAPGAAAAGFEVSVPFRLILPVFADELSTGDSYRAGRLALVRTCNAETVRQVLRHFDRHRPLSLMRWLGRCTPQAPIVVLAAIADEPDDQMSIVRLLEYSNPFFIFESLIDL